MLPLLRNLLALSIVAGRGQQNGWNDVRGRGHEQQEGGCNECHAAAVVQLLAPLHVPLRTGLSLFPRWLAASPALAASVLGADSRAFAPLSHSCARDEPWARFALPARKALDSAFATQHTQVGARTREQDVTPHGVTRAERQRRRPPAFVPTVS